MRWPFPQRRMLGRGLLVVALVGLDVTSGEFLAVAALAVTAFGYALGPIIIARRLSDIPALPVIAASLVINLVIFFFLWLIVLVLKIMVIFLKII